MENFLEKIIILCVVLVIFSASLGVTYSGEKATFAESFGGLMAVIEGIGEFASTVYDLIFDSVDWIVDQFSPSASLAAPNIV